MASLFIDVEVSDEVRGDRELAQKLEEACPVDIYAAGERGVEVDDSVRGDAELARKLEEACPVDIYAAGPEGVEIVEDNLDECVLCRLCLDASPPGAVQVVKLYDGGATL